MPLSLIIQKFDGIAEMSECDRASVRSLRGSYRALRRHEDVAQEGDRPTTVTFVATGFLCRHKSLEDGTRQITSLHVPGDIPDLHSLFVDRMDHSLSAICESQIITIPHSEMDRVLDHSRSLTRLFWRDTLIEAAIFEEWVLNIGRRDGLARVAHLFCEIMFRMNAIGLAENETCAMPLTQNEIGEATGLTAVHVNRLVQELRNRKLIRLSNGSLTVMDWQQTARLAEFNPGYLHSKGGPPCERSTRSQNALEHRV